MKLRFGIGVIWPMNSVFFLDDGGHGCDAVCNGSHSLCYDVHGRVIVELL